MGNLTIALPDPLHEWIEEQVRSGGYADASAYVLELIRDDHDRRDVLFATLTDDGKNDTGLEADEIYALSVEEHADLQEALAEVERGELASDGEIAAILSRYKG